MEGLARTIKHSAMQGISISRRTGPSISDLMFVDNVILFSRASIEDAQIIKHLLHVFPATSGLSINLSKSSIFLRSNTQIDIKNTIATHLQIQKVDIRDKLLGLPADIQRSKNQAFVNIKERLSNKTASWKENLLSKDGREVLIKSVATALTVYAMSCFKFSSSFCQ
ncbi:uncharacterized protein LOC110602012 [Manihot esculenta]|uniref:uncharacterized protein LOC110602012 n=1 Tax=Manihot esculenta TaxID=3983 RepID=UPI000B5D341D|nr:uncharacterized protein LOC110602012 [Manihot esculenta]